MTAKVIHYKESDLIRHLTPITSPMSVRLWLRTVDAKVSKKKLGLTADDTVYKRTYGTYQINFWNDPAFCSLVDNTPLPNGEGFYDHRWFFQGNEWQRHVLRPDNSETCFTRHDNGTWYLRVRPLVVSDTEYRVLHKKQWKRLPTEIALANKSSTREKMPHIHYVVRLDSIVMIKIDTKVYSLV